jgi:hypothetical protein
MNAEASGHRARLPRLLSLLGSALLVLALSCAIAWPLWALATEERLAFTIGALALIGLFLAFLVAKAIRTRIERGRS